MDGRYVKLEMDDYRKKPITKTPYKPESVLREEEEVPAERPPWDSSCTSKSFKVSAKQLEERRKLRTSHNLQAAQKELRQKLRYRRASPALPHSDVGKKDGEAVLEVKYPPPPPKVPFSTTDPAPTFSLPSLEKVNLEGGTPSSSSPAPSMDDLVTADYLTNSVRLLEDSLARVTKEYEVLKAEFEAQRSSIDLVKEERDKNRQTVKDLSRILASNQEAQLNMVNLIQGMKSKMEVLEKHGLFQVTKKVTPVVPAVGKVRSVKKVSFNLKGGKQQALSTTLALLGSKSMGSKLRKKRLSEELPPSKPPTQEQPPATRRSMSNSTIQFSSESHNYTTPT